MARLCGLPGSANSRLSVDDGRHRRALCAGLGGPRCGLAGAWLIEAIDGVQIDAGCIDGGYGQAQAADETPLPVCYPNVNLDTAVSSCWSVRQSPFFKDPRSK